MRNGREGTLSVVFNGFRWTGQYPDCAVSQIRRIGEAIANSALNLARVPALSFRASCSHWHSAETIEGFVRSRPDDGWSSLVE